MEKLLKNLVAKWKINVNLRGEKLFEKNIERRILQRDSLSPLLFVLCMDPLSRILNEKFPKITIETETMATNHLLYIDDLKLMAKEEKIIKMMCKEVSEYCKKIGLTINPKNQQQM